jgi:Zinc carboxypeptidase
VLDNEQPRRRKSELDWTRYWTLDEIYNWLQHLVAIHPNDVTLINVGTSYEGREMLGVRVNFGNVTTKKQVIFEGTIHAREWISGASVTWMLNELLTSNDPSIRAIANNYEWLIFPVINVDGYAYTWNRDRLWRKTRRPSSLICYGADPNRNWDVYFDLEGTSPNPCSDLYAGQSAFSEPETLQFSQYLAKLTNLAAYFDFHAYGQLLMLPYGWTREHLENYNELYDIGRNAIDVLKSKYGTEYVVGSIANIICEFFFLTFSII